jgi:hypothetical protein
LPKKSSNMAADKKFCKILWIITSLSCDHLEDLVSGRNK